MTPYRHCDCLPFVLVMCFDPMLGALGVRCTRCFPSITPSSTIVAISQQRPNEAYNSGVCCIVIITTRQIDTTQQSKLNHLCPMNTHHTVFKSVNENATLSPTTCCLLPSRELVISRRSLHVWPLIRAFRFAVSRSTALIPALILHLLCMRRTSDRFPWRASRPVLMPSTALDRVWSRSRSNSKRRRRS